MMARLTADVPVGGGAVVTIPNPQSYVDGGLVWRLTYSDPVAIRYIAAGAIESYAYLLSRNITMKEATRRLRLMRRAYSDLASQPEEPKP